MRFIIMIVSLLLASSTFAVTPEIITLDVQNMTCAVCPITVKKALKKVSGVTDVNIDAEHKTATVLINSEKANTALLIKATTDAGFPSTVRK